MKFVCGLIIGVLIGIVITVLLCLKNKNNTRKPSGTFVIDFSDPVKDVCRLELEEDLNVLYSKDRMILNIKTYGEDSLK